MKIYTKFGDSGETSLIHNVKVSKDSERVQACGSVDELSCYLGLIQSKLLDRPYPEILDKLQPLLFEIGSELATSPEKTEKAPMILGQEPTLELEASIDEMDADLSPLKNFILPGGTEISSHIHVARAICRRLERNVVRLNHNEKVNPNILIFINRLSDLLFVLARYFNKLDGTSDIVWKKSGRT